MYQHNLHRYDIIDAIMTAFSIKWHIPNQEGQSYKLSLFSSKTA